MKCALLALLLIAGASATEVTPVQKVIQLMQGMLEKGKKEKADEAVQFAAYKEFCADTTTEKTRSIDEANEMIGMLKADIEKYTAHAAKLGKEIAALEEEIATSFLRVPRIRLMLSCLLIMGLLWSNQKPILTSLTLAAFSTHSRNWTRSLSTRGQALKRRR
jgi:hypothetical protein